MAAKGASVDGSSPFPAVEQVTRSVPIRRRAIHARWKSAGLEDEPARSLDAMTPALSSPIGKQNQQIARADGAIAIQVGYTVVAIIARPPTR